MNLQDCIDQQITMLKLSELSPDSKQPRSYFDPDKLDELKKSIKASGIIHNKNNFIAASVPAAF